MKGFFAFHGCFVRAPASHGSGFENRVAPPSKRGFKNVELKIYFTCSN